MARQSSGASRECCCTQRCAHAYSTLRAGLRLLNTWQPTFVRRSVGTAIGLNLTTEHCAYAWAAVPETWCSGHYPLLRCPVSSRTRRSWLCCNVFRDVYRKHSAAAPTEVNFLQHISASAFAATVKCYVQPDSLVPDLRRLNLCAARRRAERRPTGPKQEITGHSTGGLVQCAGGTLISPKTSALLS